MLRILKLVAAVVVVAGAALSIGWYVLADRLGDAIDGVEAASAARGAESKCEGRDIFGFPLALKVECSSWTMAAPELHLHSGPAGFSAPLYRPGHAEFVLSGPLDIAPTGLPPLSADWEMATGSIDAWTDGIDTMVFELTAARVSPRDATDGISPLARSAQTDLRVARDGGNLVVEGAMDDLVLALDGTASPAVDLSADAVLDGASGLLGPDGTGRGLRGRAGAVRLARLALDGGDGAIELAGPFRISQEGLLSATLELRLDHPDAIASAVETSFPPLASLAGNLASTVQLVGQQQGDVIVMPLTIRNGFAAIGLIPLGRIPPLG
ncbi:DUF2125 domain-containing protein [Consotaella salsifontis]|uniref:DUF2125 domain-containing protein n=1 Tax=Consotaella salsifontis TaxID=1365950 RepID=A0A1T4RR62_9HYPH|nr:DUF2125 domain-containing protein [Consotaella salsifontis]SKA18454.1 hypothetical protein SAMN05428963_107194 [Consotaella salsifontis]